MAASRLTHRALRLIAFVAPASLCLAVLWAHAVAARPRPLWQLEYRRWVDGQMYSAASWRYWEDVKFAINRYLERRYGPAPVRHAPGGQAAPPTTNLEMTRQYTEALWNQTARLAIEPYQFWRRVPDRPFVRRYQAYVLPYSEDAGRGAVAAVAFEVFGGISPYAVLWLGPLFFIPCVLWCYFEWWQAGRAIGGLVFIGTLALSPYVVESLTLPHSAVGFYLSALVVAVALALYAAGPSRSPAGYFLRAGAAGGALALCAFCRSGSLLIAPAYAVCLLVAGRRIWGGRGMGRAYRAWFAWLVACVLLSAPYIAVRPTQRHAIWQGGFWAGLGDYGRDRGYSWHDRDGKRFLLRQGVKPFTHPNEVTPEQEAVYRRAVLRDVTGHPLWYARILAQRFAATVTQSKLLPWKPLDGHSVSEPIFHYKYVTPIDYFGWPRHYVEIPLPVLLLTVPVLVLVRLRRRMDGPLRQDALILLAFALATLPLPVLVSTAAGIETQGFALVYLISLALLVDAVACRAAAPTL